MSISKRKFAKLMEKANIIKVVRLYLGNIPMKKYDRLWNLKYLMKCPFHDEKTPSFAIFPNSNSFCCYGCGQSGNVIDLVVHFEVCTERWDAISKLAQIFEINIPGGKTNNTRARRRERKTSRKKRIRRKMRQWDTKTPQNAPFSIGKG